MTVHRPRPTEHDRVPGPQLPGVVSGITLAVGCWLVFLSLSGDYGVTAVWNDRLVGLAVAVVGVLRLTRLPRLRTVSAAGAATGLWLTLSPFALDYGFTADSSRAILADALAGIVLITLTLVGHVRG